MVLLIDNSMVSREMKKGGKRGEEWGRGV